MIFGTKIVLGPILPVDIPALFQWSDDAEDARLNEPYLPPNWQRQEAFWLNAQADPSRIFFAIRQRSAPEIIGSVQIRDIHPIHRCASIGLRIGKASMRGQGYGREALMLGIDYCWRQLNLSRLTLTVFAGNERALALYHSCGFRVEGQLRRALFIDGEWIDVVLMGLLHPERERR